MKTIITLSLFLISQLSLFSQQDNYISGKITDSENNPLDYVNIGIIGTSLGTVSDLDGNFQLFFDASIDPNSIIRFSSIGYESQNFAVSELNLKKSISITLKTKSTQLQEVVVLPDLLTTKNKTKGNNNTTTRMSVFYSISKKPNQNLGAEIGRKFRIKKPTQINTVRFYIAKNNFDTAGFRINIYHLKKRKPLENILTQNIIKEVVGKKSGWIEVDLTPYKIITDKPVVVGVEWIYHSKKGKSLKLPITIPAIGAVHFYKYGSQNKWKRFNAMSSCMEIDIAY